MSANAESLDTRLIVQTADALRTAYETPAAEWAENPETLEALIKLAEAAQKWLDVATQVVDLSP